MIALAAALFLIAAPLEPAIQSAEASASIEVALKGGKAEGARTHRVKRGDEVTLRIASDRKIALHLHGYDIERTAEPGKPAVFNFTAKATGRFSLEEHIADAGKKSHGHAPAILYLEVLPK
ncbi:MAG: hypothetical protein K0Q70_2380 [Rhodospirillales bacterium]|jgi:hypothetical protein|nr:hypothetical protein [Rhodospirillales bacterium]